MKGNFMEFKRSLKDQLETFDTPLMNITKKISSQMLGELNQFS